MCVINETIQQIFSPKAGKKNTVLCLPSRFDIHFFCHVWLFVTFEHCFYCIKHAAEKKKRFCSKEHLSCVHVRTQCTLKTDFSASQWLNSDNLPRPEILILIRGSHSVPQIAPGVFVSTQIGKECLRVTVPSSKLIFCTVYNTDNRDSC